MINFNNSEYIQLPDVVELVFKKIHKDYLKVILMNFSFSFFIVFLAVFLITNFGMDVEFSTSIFYFYTVPFLVLMLILVFLLIGFPKRQYILRERDLSYKSGVFYKTLTTVPFSRIQHIEIDERPFSRIFKLASISVFTAGDSSDDIVIKGIKKMDALQIKEYISQRING